MSWELARIKKPMYASWVNHSLNCCRVMSLHGTGVGREEGGAGLSLGGGGRRRWRTGPNQENAMEEVRSVLTP